MGGWEELMEQFGGRATKGEGMERQSPWLQILLSPSLRSMWLSHGSVSIHNSILYVGWESAHYSRIFQDTCHLLSGKTVKTLESFHLQCASWMPGIITSTAQNQSPLPNPNSKMRGLLYTLVAITDIKMQVGSVCVFWLSSLQVLVIVEWSLDPASGEAKMNCLGLLPQWLIFQKTHPPPLCSHWFQMFWILLKENQWWAPEIWRWKRSSFFYEWPSGMGHPNI